tara:strand:- start:2734 stop:3831 length:1098 start_codon:yes stop_codon:yes gene_type:complete
MSLPPLYLPHPGTRSIVPTDGLKRPRTGDGEEAEETEKKEAYDFQGVLFGFYQPKKNWAAMTELEKEAERMSPSNQIPIGVNGEPDPRLPIKSQVMLQLSGQSKLFDFKKYQCGMKDAVMDFEEKLRTSWGSLAIAATPQGEVVGAMSIEGRMLRPEEWGNVVQKMLEGNDDFQKRLEGNDDLKTELMQSLDDFRPLDMREMLYAPNTGGYNKLRFYIDYACTGGGNERPGTLINDVNSDDYGKVIPVGGESHAPPLRGTMRFILNSMSTLIDTLYVQPTVERMVNENWIFNCRCYGKARTVVRRLCHYELFSVSDALPAWAEIGFMQFDPDADNDLYKPVFDDDEIPAIAQPTIRPYETIRWAV